MKAIPAVLFVVLQWLLHERRDLGLPHIGAGALNASVTREISERLEAEHNVPPPSLAWLEVFTLTDLKRVRKACCKILRVLIFQLHLVGKRHELPPNCAVASQRSSAIAKLVQLA